MTKAHFGANAYSNQTNYVCNKGQTGRTAATNSVRGDFSNLAKSGACPAHGHGSANTYQGSGSNIDGLRLAVGRLESMINSALSASSAKPSNCGSGHQNGSIEQEISNLLKDLGAAVSQQAQGDKACSAAGQMSNLTNKLDMVISNGPKQDSQGSQQMPNKQEVQQLLNEISTLLKRLSASLHANEPFHGTNKPRAAR